MAGVWREDGTYEYAPGERARLKGKEKGKDKGKGKGEKGKGDKGKGEKGRGKGKDKGKDSMTAAERLAYAQGALSAEGPPAKKAKTGEAGAEDEEEEELPEFDFEKDWKDKQVALLNLKGAKDLNGLMGVVKEYNEETKRFLIVVDGKGEKSIKMENIFKVMTGCIVKLRGLDAIELNDCIGECGRLDVENLRYDITLSDGRHVKAKPANVELVAKYETSKVAGDVPQMDRIRAANGLRDRLTAVEEFDFPAPLVLPAAALEEYSQKFPKSVVIGRSNAANPKGAQGLAREVVSATKVPPGARLVFVSVPRERCVAPALADMRHDELLRLGKFGSWLIKRLSPRPVYFLVPGAIAKGPPAALNSATCAWPLYVELCTDMVILESERWQKSPWARMDALMAVWAKTPLYLLPEKYQPAVALPDASPAAPAAAEDDAKNTAATEPLSFSPETPFTIGRPVEGLSNPSALLLGLCDRAAEAEASGGAKVQKPTLAVKRLC
mmetsp:Transcript_25445/g.57580  ORF Transcript_25445/g.57580 Transcript_25445/m.57580 type:complete len:497 (+) Transcript_25445:82-1572(+)